MSAKNTVCLISSDAALSNSLKTAFRTHGLTLISHANVKEFLESHDEDQPVGCVITEMRNGLEVMQELGKGNCMLPAVLLSGGASLSAAVQAAKAGAFDVVEKPDLVESVKKATALFVKYQKLFDERAVASTKIGSLTKRETQVFNLMVQGMPNRTIAEEIGISPKTLDIHRSNLMDKMEARTPADLCRANLLARTNPMLLPLILA